MMASYASPTYDAAATSSEKPMFRRRRGPRCQLCKRQHQKCRFTHDREVCDRCLNLGYECRLVVRTERRPTPPVRAPRAKRGSNTFKCDACRQHHQKCEPEDRVWPARCTRCIKQKQQCTPPHDALGRNIPYIRGGGSGGGGDDVDQGVVEAINSGSRIEPWPGRSVLLSDHAPLPPAAYGSELLGSSSEETPASAFGLPIPRPIPVLPAPREPSPSPSEAEGQGPSRARTRRTLPTTDHMATGTTTGETIRRMEDEFHDVLRQLEKKHTRELETQRYRYEEELGVQRDRYEQRLDDLIRIMRNMGKHQH